jgi:hypothetical protein
MTKFQKLSLFVTIAAFCLGMSACSKKNDQLETDYATKKASAQTLLDQIGKSTDAMKADHATWSATLDAAWNKPGADTAKINSLRNDMKQHMADGQAIMALEDSVKAYMNATPDQGDAFKNADDRLGANFNDLNDKWKSFQDKHNSLQQSVQQFAVNTAGTAAGDTAKAKTEGKPAPKPAKKEAPKPAPAPKPAEHHGATRVPAH